ncbi:DEAD/DEAH box helicase [Solicola gregarius]|uniref:DEAD/DEAH box helicase n=1 Tax=Solicola gregarius TaxID=2908642 RepID=A0AA46TG68_9ACTN|nr:DEAD/DEAH box helicase [Solicola gregarius]UYM04726.1 DEAD/DEAH box helicase [Solicola gregarius]
MVDWAAALSDSAIEAAVGTPAFQRGAAYARDGHVGHVKVNRNVIFGRVRGTAADPYQLIVVAEHDISATRVSATCTCPVGVNCKHAAAAMIAARDHVAPLPVTRSTGWRRALDDFVRSNDAPLPDEAPLALQFTATRDSAAAYDPRLEQLRRVTIRPLMLGKRGRWIRAGISWRDLRDPWRQTPCRSDHVELLRQVYASAGDATRYAYDQAELDLGDFPPAIWKLLAEAREIGLDLVGRSHGPVGLRAVGAAVFLDVSRGTDRDVTLAPGVRIGDERVPIGSVGLLGWPPHGLFRETGGSLELVPLAEPPSEHVTRLLGETIAIPADEVDAFVADYYPVLGRAVEVRSSDDTVELPEIAAPRLRLSAAFRPGHEVRLGWSYVYAADDDERAYRLDDPADGRRDPGAERELLVRATRIVSRWSGLLDRSGMIAADAVLHGMDTAAFVEDALPVLDAEPVIDVDTSGEVPAYAAADGTPLVRVSATDDADGTDWFDLRVTVSVGGEDVPFEQLFAALARGDSQLILDSGTYFRIDDPGLDRLRRLIEEARSLQDRDSDGLRISPFQVGLWEELVELGVVGSQSRRWQRRVDGLLDLDSIEPLDVPASVDAVLRPYQLDGFRWLSFLYEHRLGGILADDMGLGKTLQTLAMIVRARATEPAAGPFLVVAPTSVVQNWARECERFTPGLQLVSITETAARRGMPLRAAVGHADVVVTSYALFRLEYDAYDALDWSGLVLDEAQFVKNHQAKTYQCVRRLAAPFKVAITGTPLENSLMDLWSMLSIVAPGLFPNPNHFKERFRNPIERGKDTEALESLRRRVRPLMRRRTKELVAADLPPKQEQVLEVVLSPQHRRLYQTHLQRERQKILRLLDEPDDNRFTILRSLTLLRQLSLDPYLIDDAYADVRSSKVDALMEQLGEVVDEGHRALVFSQFTRFLGRVRERLDAEGIAYSYLDGTTRDRAAAVDEFKSGRAPVFLISLKAGGFGLNLTEADYCFVLDPWWNPAVEEQAVDRAHRIGQTRRVMIYRLVSADTIEEKVMELKARKRDLVARVLDDTAGELSAPLSANDIRGLLG